MSSIHQYTISQRLVIRLGESLVSWAQRRAAARAHRRAAALEQAERRLLHTISAEQRREEAILRYLLGPRQF